MGTLFCTTQKQALKDIIEIIVKNKKIPLNKKIYQEYLLLKELNELKNSSRKKVYYEKKLITAGFNNTTNIKKKLNDFKKWYSMLEPKETEKLSNTSRHFTKTTTINTTRSSPKKIKTSSEVNKNEFCLDFTAINNKYEKVDKNDRKRVSVDIKKPKFPLQQKNITLTANLTGTFSKCPTNKSPDSIKFDDDTKLNNLINIKDNIKDKVDIEKALCSFYNNSKDKFNERVQQGPPKSLRWISWLISCNINSICFEDYYNTLQKRELDMIQDIQIKKDLTRTISNEYQNNNIELQKFLYRVLKAVALTDIQVSYCQGMNFIAGFLLISSDFNEVEAFYMMLMLLGSNFDKRFGIRGFFIEEFPLLNFYTFAFNKIFQQRLPQLNQLFKNLEIPDEAWIVKWFQTLYCVCLPLNLVTRLWDCLMTNGIAFLLNFSIALLKLFEKDLLASKDCFAVLDYFKKYMSPYGGAKGELTFFCDEDKLIEDALNVNISNDYLAKLQLEFEETKLINLDKFTKSYNIIQHNHILLSTQFSSLIRKINNSSKSLINKEDEKYEEYIEGIEGISNKSSAPISDIRERDLTDNNITPREENYIIFSESDKGKTKYYNLNKSKEEYEEMILLSGDDINLKKSIILNDDYMNVSFCNEFDLGNNNAGIDDKINTHTFKGNSKNEKIIKTVSSLGNMNSAITNSNKTNSIGNLKKGVTISSITESITKSVLLKQKDQYLNKVRNNISIIPTLKNIKASTPVTLVKLSKPNQPNVSNISNIINSGSLIKEINVNRKQSITKGK